MWVGGGGKGRLYQALVRMKRLLLALLVLVLGLAIYRYSRDTTDMQALKNVIVVGGSYVGSGTATKLASALPPGYRVLLIEPHSHFHHLFAFPRFAIVPAHEHKAFIPYTHLFASIPPPHAHAVVQAKAVTVEEKVLHLDRPWNGRRELEFEYLVVATGTRLPSPGSMSSDAKLDGVGFFQTYQKGVERAQEVVIVGGGAVGVQMALDIAEVYPQKKVTLVHSRDKVMTRFDPRLDSIVRKRFAELGVECITGERVVVPPQGYPTDGTRTTVNLTSGHTLPADLVILATGQIPNNHLLRELDSVLPPTDEKLINQANGFLRVLPTLQLANPRFRHIFALGDIADTGAPKAARPGIAQADVVVHNVAALIAGAEPTKVIEVGPPAIHLTLGLRQNVIFRNPETPGGEPMIKMRDDGQEDMGIDGVWTRRGITVRDVSEYHL